MFGDGGQAVAYAELKAERVAVVVEDAEEWLILPGERLETREPP